MPVNIDWSNENIPSLIIHHGFCIPSIICLRRQVLTPSDRSIRTERSSKKCNTLARVFGFDDVLPLKFLIVAYIVDTSHEAHKLRWESSFLITFLHTRFDRLVNKSLLKKNTGLYESARVRVLQRNSIRVHFHWSARRTRKVFPTKSCDLRFTFILVATANERKVLPIIVMKTWHLRDVFLAAGVNYGDKCNENSTLLTARAELQDIIISFIDVKCIFIATNI